MDSEPSIQLLAMTDPRTLVKVRSTVSDTPGLATSVWDGARLGQSASLDVRMVNTHMPLPFGATECLWRV
jgi:hypothetical protein